MQLHEYAMITLSGDDLSASMWIVAVDCGVLLVRVIVLVGASGASPCSGPEARTISEALSLFEG